MLIKWRLIKSVRNNIGKNEILLHPDFERGSDSDNHFPTIRIPHQEIEYFKTLIDLILLF